MRYANSDRMTLVLFCEDCENQSGVCVDLFCNFSDRSVMALNRRRIQIKKFSDLHADCGSQILDLGIGLPQTKWDEEVVMIQKIYTENPGIAFDEVRLIFKGLNEMRAETGDAASRTP